MKIVDYKGRIFLAFALVLAGSHHKALADPPPADQDVPLAALSLEELTKVEITSVARKDQKLLKVAAAAFVITADDIRRSGATSIPDLLRVVPGLEVAQINAGDWAVSARGFNGRSANKILVLVDGRSIYNNLYSGTFWDQNQIPLDDIERIEVIRGPGATMWGANAVDGIISIITKKAKETQGLTISAEAGRNQLPDAEVRYGGALGNAARYRVDSRFTENMNLVNSSGSPAYDRENSGEGGARIDWNLSRRDTLTADGQIYRGSGRDEVNPAFPLPSALASGQKFSFYGGFLRGRWERQLDNSDLALEISYTREARTEWVANGTLDTLDVDFQHHLFFGRRNDFNWGGGIRFRDDNIKGLIQPAHVQENLFSVFAQDEFSLLPNRLSVTAGIKVQDFANALKNDPEIQPQVRLLWTPDAKSSFWAALSRAVRTPSEIEQRMQLSFALPEQNGIPVSGLLSGNPSLPGEVLIAWEAGYRRQIAKRFTIDLAGFYNQFSRLIETVSGTPYLVFSPAPVVIAPQTYASIGGADTRGVELSATWSPRRTWRLQLAYAWENAAFQAPLAVAVTAPPGSVWDTPAHTGSIRSSWDVTRRWSVDCSLYAASEIVQQSVPAYARVDVRVARKFGEGGEFSAGVQNLFNETHLEFRSEDYLAASYLRRNVFAKVVWHF
jgi:iron complex outermembrane receptor protein